VNRIVTPSLVAKGQSKDTIKRRQAALRRFIHWCDERDLKTPQEITKPILERYQRHLYYYRNVRPPTPPPGGKQGGFALF
jgi:integrase/recombinase XerD